MSAGGNNFVADDASHFAGILDHLHIGIWEYNIITRDVKWSEGFYAALGYKPGEIECSYNYFLEQLLYHQDKPAFLKAFHARAKTGLNTVAIRLLTKNSGYQWFENTIKKWDDGRTPRLSGSIINIHQCKLLELNAVKNDFLFKETGSIAKVSGWELDIPSRIFKLTKHAYDIFEVAMIYKSTLNEKILILQKSKIWKKYRIFFQTKHSHLCF